MTGNELLSPFDYPSHLLTQQIVTKASTVNARRLPIPQPQGATLISLVIEQMRKQLGTDMTLAEHACDSD